jgi:hypothetical protein
VPSAFRVLLGIILGLTLAVPFLLGHSLRPRPPLDLHVQENGGQLCISWNPDAVGNGRSGRFEASDRSAREIWAIAPRVHSVTYAYGAEDTRVNLTLDGKSGVEIVRRGDAKESDINTRVHQEAEKFALDFSDVVLLRATIERENKQLDSLQKSVRALSSAVTTRSKPKSVSSH